MHHDAHIRMTCNYVTNAEADNRGKLASLVPVLGLKKFLYKSATDRKRRSLGHHVHL